MSSGTFDRTPKKLSKTFSQYRNVITPLPVPESIELMESIDKYESRSMHGQYPIVWDRAEGFQVYDAWGNTWLDFTSTIFVANSGHGNKNIVNAIDKVINKPLLHAYNYYSKERADYLKYLIENTPDYFEKAFLLSAGTEATECALKLMRMHGQKVGKNRLGIIAFEGAWHGRTLGAQMMGANEQQKEWIGYHDPNIHHLPYPYPWIKEVIDDPRKFFFDSLTELFDEKWITPDDISGFMLETFQGWGAVFFPPAYVKAVKEFAEEYDILVAFDEMQAGFGRTGKLFGYMHYDVDPDLICCGKGASSSLPLSFVLGKTEVMDLPDVGSMSSTHSASPIVCAAGLANFQTIIEDGLVEQSKQLGKIFLSELNAIKDDFPHHVSFICGEGLLAAMHFHDDAGNPLSELCTNICELLLHRGLLVVHTGRETIKLAPPLTITEEALRDGLEAIREAIRDCV